MAHHSYADRSPVLSVLCLAAFMGACDSGGSDSFNTPNSLTVAQTVLESPAGPGSGEPFLAAGPDAIYLSWLEAVPEGGHDMRFSRLEGDQWSAPGTIAHGENFFVNWADFPSITPGTDGTLWAHWLQRGEAGGYDYGVRIARSSDGGMTWSEPWTPHDDDSPTEHGFVSTIPLESGMAFAWLDGRKHAEGADGTPATGEMTLRYRVAGHDGPGPEMLVDGRVCDCCQTAAAMTSSGPLVVYRNRTEDEIRDIHVSRLVDGSWTESRAVHDDGWEIAGCPVNGPAVVARGSDVVVAWFTAAGDVPHVKVAFSSDAGVSFGEPVVVDDGNPGGRVDLLMTNDGNVLVSWLERTGGENAEVRLRKVSRGGATTESASLTTASAERASGFPRIIESNAGDIVIAWTDVGMDESRVRVSRLQLQ